MSLSVGNIGATQRRTANVNFGNDQNQDTAGRTVGHVLLGGLGTGIVGGILGLTGVLGKPTEDSLVKSVQKTVKGQIDSLSEYIKGLKPGDAVNLTDSQAKKFGFGGLIEKLKTNTTEGLKDALEALKAKAKTVTDSTGDLFGQLKNAAKAVVDGKGADAMKEFDPSITKLLEGVKGGKTGAMWKWGGWFAVGGGVLVLLYKAIFGKKQAA